MAFGQIDILQVEGLNTELTNIGTDISDHIADTANPHSVTAAQVGAIATTAKGAANGVAELDGNGKVPASQIPAVALERIVVVADETARFALTLAEVQEGDVVKQALPLAVFVVSDSAELDNAAGYTQISTATVAPVDSVFGRIGEVVAVAGDYGTDEITNDSDVTGTYLTTALNNLKTAVEEAVPVYEYLDQTPTGTVNGVNLDFTVKVSGVTVEANINETEVYVKNLWQEPGVNYTWEGSSPVNSIIRFAVAPPTGFPVRVRGKKA